MKGFSMNAIRDTAQTPGMLYFERCKTQCEAGLALANALVAGSERMRAAQLDAVRETEAQIRHVAEQIGKVTTMPDLLTLQGGLVNDYYLGAVRYWTNLTKLTQQTQVEVLGLMRKHGSQSLDQATVTNSEGSLPALSGPFAAVMQMALDVTRGTNDAIVKALRTNYAPASTERKS